MKSAFLNNPTKSIQSWFSLLRDGLLHIAFPHVCEGCGTDILDKNHLLCLQCSSNLPATSFHLHDGNPIEKAFWGRMPVTHATAQYYFTKESLMQRLMHQVKYRGNKDLAIYLGRMMGHQLAASNRFSYVDGLVPLPLHPIKERKRGFNQATLLCEGIAEVLSKPVWKNVVIRKSSTESQTKKNRVERWQNMEGSFELVKASSIEGKHILLVDDVITTGATLEACGQELLRAENVKLSIATLCFSST